MVSSDGYEVIDYSNDYATTMLPTYLVTNLRDYLISVCPKNNFMSFRPKGEICKSNIFVKIRFLTSFGMTAFKNN